MTRMENIKKFCVWLIRFRLVERIISPASSDCAVLNKNLMLFMLILSR